ncbi:hypothetical protein vseg_008004 [Gypsophila vaccaria]
MSNNQTTPHIICTVNPYQFLRIEESHDGLITRLQNIPSTPPCNDLNSPFNVLSKDVPLNLENKTSLRLFLPKIALKSSSSAKLPIIIYFHGGGFIFHHPNSTMFHNFCMKLSSVTTSLVVSLDYRLAPEHRLPAAYEDGLETLQWLFKSSHDIHNSHVENWVTKYGDFSNCFLMGSSAGGTLAYKVGLRISTMVEKYNPMKIKGWILHSPSFGGSNRTRSEVNHVNDSVVPLSVIDLFSEKCLPVGADPGHDYLNVRSSTEDEALNHVQELGWRVLVTGGSRDPFVDRQIELVKLLGDKGVIVRSHFAAGDTHALEIFDADKCERFLIIFKDFISSCVSSTNDIGNLMRIKSNL